MKNILIVGLGSIGQRHYRNLKKIDKKLNFFAIRKKFRSPRLDKKNQVINSKLNCKDLKISLINQNEINEKKIDLAFITNPTSLHIETAKYLVKKNCNIFIEKPLSNSIKGVAVLKKLIREKKINCEIGFQTRYDPLLKELKKIIVSKKFGKIVNVNINHNSYLPYHHEYENYKIGYAAKKELGGGVLLCFSHELDYAFYLFGKPRKIIPNFINNGSALRINVETAVGFSLEFNKNINVNFSLDFLRKKPKRSCEIQFEKAHIIWDLNKKKILKDGSVFKKTPELTRDNLFKIMLSEVLHNFRKQKNSKNTFENSLDNLRIIIKIKESLNKKKIIALKKFFNKS